MKKIWILPAARSGKNVNENYLNTILTPKNFDSKNQSVWGLNYKAKTNFERINIGDEVWFYRSNSEELERYKLKKKYKNNENIYKFSTTHWNSSEYIFIITLEKIHEKQIDFKRFSNLMGRVKNCIQKQEIIKGQKADILFTEIYLNNYNTKGLRMLVGKNRETIEKTTVNNLEVQKLRRQFVQNLKKELIQKNSTNFENENNFKRVECCHIIPVAFSIYKGHLNEINDKNNGLVLDPNTHKVLDLDMAEISEDGTIHSDYWNFKIDNKFLTPARLSYIKMRKKYFVEIKKFMKKQQ